MLFKHIYTISLFVVLSSILSTNQAYCHYKEIKSMKEYEKISNSGHPMVVMFSAPWCGACQVMKTAFTQVANTYKHANFYIVNTDIKSLNPLVKTLNILALPTTIMTNGRNEIKRERGSLSRVELDKSVGQFVTKLPESKKPNSKKSNTKAKPKASTNKSKKSKNSRSNKKNSSKKTSK